MDIPRIFNITESAHRIHNPITPEKLATLGVALRRVRPASVSGSTPPVSGADLGATLSAVQFVSGSAASHSTLPTGPETRASRNFPASPRRS